jgi:alpha-tubulin suppressor-like RCC1 family protein
MHRNVELIEAQARLDRRSVDTGMTVEDGYALVWGLAYYGISGGPAPSWLTDATGQAYPPTPVHGLPQGAIVDMASGIYEFNALDTAGCVWGWGWHGSRDGTGTGTGASSSSYSAPPEKLRARMRSNEGTAKDDLCNIVAISRTREAGAGIDSAGRVWSWGSADFGGPGQASAGLSDNKNYPGPQLVEGLPQPPDGENRPIAIQGGRGTFWVTLANGDIWYFGGDNSDLNSNERPAGDQPNTYSGVAPGTTRSQAQPKPDMSRNLPVANRRPVRAARSEALSGWFRSNPAAADEYIVQVHSGIQFGSALLSNGKVLTWGQDNLWSALGRQCSGGASASQACARTPAYAAFPATPNPDGTVAVPKAVGLSCSFTACFVITETGDLWGYGVPARSYEAHNVLDETPFPVLLAHRVSRFQAGQGYVIWWTMDGNTRGLGYNPRGSLGIHAGNWGQRRGGFFSETKERELWFGKYEDRWCIAFANQVNSWSTSSLPSGWYKQGGKVYNAQGVMVHDGSDYTSGDFIQYDKECAVFNNPANRLSWQYCVDQAIALARPQEGLPAEQRVFTAGCS